MVGVFSFLGFIGAGGRGFPPTGALLFTVFLRHVPVLARLKWGYPIILAP